MVETPNRLSNKAWRNEFKSSASRNLLVSSGTTSNCAENIAERYKEITAICSRCHLIHWIH